MHINELYEKLNNFRDKQGLPPKSQEDYLAEISQMQLEGKIRIENGEVKPTNNDKEIEL